MKTTIDATKKNAIDKETAEQLMKPYQQKSIAELEEAAAKTKAEKVKEASSFLTGIREHEAEKAQEFADIQDKYYRAKKKEAEELKELERMKARHEADRKNEEKHNNDIYIESEKHKAMRDTLKGMLGNKK